MQNELKKSFYFGCLFVLTAKANKLNSTIFSPHKFGNYINSKQVFVSKTGEKLIHHLRSSCRHESLQSNSVGVNKNCNGKNH